jgi:hypothetical protein
MLPYTRADTRDVVEHHQDDETRDMIGYTGADPGDPLTVPTVSIAAFSSTLFHRTGPTPASSLVACTSPSTRPSRC